MGKPTAPKSPEMPKAPETIKPVTPVTPTAPPAETAQPVVPPAPPVNPPVDPAPQAEDKNAADSDVKTNDGDQGAASTDEPVEVKSNFARIRIDGFRGAYRDARFDDDGVCERISKETIEELQKDFPGIEAAKFQIID